MAINLTKGQTINLGKDEHDLSTLSIGLGWKIKKKGLLSFLGQGGEYDLDAVAFLLNETGKVANVGNERLQGGDVIFFNNLKHPSGTVWHSGDNRVGGEGSQDDEQIVLELNRIPPQYHRVLFLVSIYKGIEKKQHFGEVESAFIRASDAKGKEIARYNLDKDPSYVGQCTMLFGEVYRKDQGWKFRALGEAHQTDAFVRILKNYLP